MVSMLEPGLGVTSPLFLLYNRVACVTGAIKKGRGRKPFSFPDAAMFLVSDRDSKSPQSLSLS